MLRVVAIALGAYALHFAWEMGQGPLFATMALMSFWRATAWCARAAGWDVVISAAAYGAATLGAGRVRWVVQRRWWPFAIYFAVGLSVTIVIELWAVSIGRWQYRDAMPTIAGIGLSPLLQWIIIPAAIVFIVRRVTRGIPST